MRILIYGYEFPPIGGGVANALKNLFEYYSKDTNLQIDFITTSVDGKYSIEKYAPNITFYKLNLGDRRHRLNSQKPSDMIKFIFKSYIQTWKLILKNKYDLAWAFGFPGSLVPFLFRWRMPYFTFLRGVDVPGYNDRFKKWYFIFKPLSYLTWHFSDKIIANSNGLKELAEETYTKKKILVIPNGIDTEKFKPVDEKSKFKKFTITQGGTLFGRKKGLEYLIKAFGKFNKEFPDTRLMMIGDGDLKPEYDGIIQNDKIDNVEFVGRQENNWIAKNLPKCHVFCLPSINEGMSNSALEALASGLPLILTDTGGTDVLLSNANGFIVNKRNSNEIFSKLKDLYRDKNLRIEQGKRSRKVAQELSWQETSNKYYKLMNKYEK